MDFKLLLFKLNVNLKPELQPSLRLGLVTGTDVALRLPVTLALALANFRQPESLAVRLGVRHDNLKSLA